MLSSWDNNLPLVTKKFQLVPLSMKKKSTSKYARAEKVQNQFVTGFSDALILPFKDHFTGFSLIESRKGLNCLFNFVAMGHDVIQRHWMLV